MKVNNPILDTTKPILINSSTEYDRVAKILTGRGYKCWASKTLLIIHKVKDLPTYLKCNNSKLTVSHSRSLNPRIFESD